MFSQVEYERHHDAMHESPLTLLLGVSYIEVVDVSVAPPTSKSVIISWIPIMDPHCEWRCTSDTHTEHIVVLSEPRV